MKEFKKFISRGNVIDLAVGVIIGGAFGKIVSSIVEDVLMPIIGILLGGLDFTGLSLKVGDASIKYGNLMQNIIDFLIIAASIFLMTKAINRLFHKEEEKEKIIPKNSETLLLEEIRDLLKEQKNQEKTARRKTTKKKANEKKA